MPGLQLDHVVVKSSSQIVVGDRLTCAQFVCALPQNSTATGLLSCGYAEHKATCHTILTVQKRYVLKKLCAVRKSVKSA
jgi:hypothetical protein